MAFPTMVRRGSAVSGTTNLITWSPTFSFTVTNGLNTAIADGESVLWVVVVSGDGDWSSGGSANGWTREAVVASAGAVTGAIFTMTTTGAYAAGAHPSFPFTTGSASEQYSGIMYAVKATTAGATLTFQNGNSAVGSSTNSDPGTFPNPVASSQDFLLVVTRSGDSTVVATAPPGGYGNHISRAGGGSGGASTNGADSQITLSQLGVTNPGTFTSATEQWVCFTFGFYETAGGGGGGASPWGFAYILGF